MPSATPPVRSFFVARPHSFMNETDDADIEIPIQDVAYNFVTQYADDVNLVALESLMSLSVQFDNVLKAVTDSYANVYKTKEITLLNVQLVPCYTLHVYVC